MGQKNQLYIKKKINKTFEHNIYMIFFFFLKHDDSKTKLRDWLN